jgi:peptidoglycan/xylan/chitin deacetylase (PgdA/CDA1 family)
MQYPSFSIVVPTFERREVVCSAVEAIARIRYPGPLELVVIVDGSTDGTAEALEAIACPFPRKIVWQANAGLARARNRGAEEASGTILLFLDDDMICEPDVVERHAESHRQGADAVLGHIPLDPSSPPGLLSEVIARWVESRAESLSDGAPLTLFDLLGGHLSVRRDAFFDVGGFDEAFTAGGTYGNEDIDFGIRLLGKYRVSFNGEAVARQRYIVTPRHHMQQYFESGQADVAFARKHPELGPQLFALHGAGRTRTRLLLRPLASVRWIARMARSVAVVMAEKHDALPRLARPVMRRLFFDARDIVYWSGVHERGGIPRSREALVLCYHAVQDLTGDPILSEYGLPPPMFAAQLDRLLARGFTFITPDKFAALIEDRGPVPAKAVLLTFDDCYGELPEIARAVLKPRGITALAFAVTGMASHTNEWDNKAGSRTLQVLDSAGLAELQACGVEIGCHSRTHRPMPTLTDAELRMEIAGAAADLAACGVRTPRFFAYPFGLLDGRSKAAVERAGFAAGFGLTTERANSTSDRLNLPRVEILARDGSLRFWLKTRWPAATPALEWPRRLVRLPPRVFRKLVRSLGPATQGVAQMKP